MPTTKPRKSATPSAIAPRSLVSRILDTMRHPIGKPLTIADIAARIGEPYKRTRYAVQALYTVRYRNGIERVGKGTYRLPRTVQA